jgi:hypothetical protein
MAHHHIYVFTAQWPSEEQRKAQKNHTAVALGMYIATIGFSETGQFCPPPFFKTEDRG